MATTRIILGLCLGCLLLSMSAMGQTTTSTIQGTVTDPNAAVVPGAEVKASGTTLAVERTTTTDEDGFYRLTALPAGAYTLTVTRTGFAPSTSNIELTLNRVVTVDVSLQVGDVRGEVVDVGDVLPLLNTETPSTGLTVTPRQITELPVNGRNYLDLFQLVPGVAVNRHVNPDGDNATPVLGERSGNNNFFIDGHPNKNTVDGGPAAQFNQETIAEFQVLTTGYKAEFGQASGAMVNVITKSGGNEFHGVASFFLRDDVLDSSNSLNETTTELPLRRYDYSLAAGGPVIKDKWFFFGSAERITESRQLDFKFPDTGNAVVNQLLRDQETPFNTPALTAETRAFLKFNQQFGRHQLSQEANYTNGRVKNFLPLSAASSLPSSRNDSGARRLLVAFGDTVLLGDQGNPYILTLRGAYRGEKSDTLPSHPELGGATLFVPFDPATCTFATCTFLGNLPRVSFGNAATPSGLDQKYTSFTANLNKRFGDHDIKFGLNFLRTVVDGVDTRNADDQLFTTPADFASFGAGSAGPILRRDTGGITPAGDEIHLRNNYTALFVQDDFKIRHNLTLNLGVRWDYDSEFAGTGNFAPRLGFAWAINPKTVLRANFGAYYDQFRLGLARDIPEFGGTDQRFVQYLLFPRLIHGSPSFITSLPLLSGFRGACFSNALVGNLTDAQIATLGLRCPFSSAIPLVGVDRFNNIVAAGRAPIPANTVVTVHNVQALTGLTPEQFAAQASASIGTPGLLFFTPSGFLGHPILPPQVLPVTLDSTFKTPHTLGFNIGVQREIGRDMVVEADYFHRDIRNLLGPRASNLAFESRVLGVRYLPPNTAVEIRTFGPFFEGQYDALILNFSKRFSRRFQLGTNYTYARATDNSLGVQSEPSDAFVGFVPIVTEPATGRSNVDNPFTTTVGRFVEKAGVFLNGPDRDKGPSDLALDHIFQINGLFELPYQIQVSGIFRAQSGFHYSRATTSLIDADGNGRTNSIDLAPGRNAFTAPPLVNLDMRFSKRFSITERVKLQLLFEFFNLLNRQNPAAVERLPNITGQPFGSTVQVLPGREGQFGFRLEF